MATQFHEKRMHEDLKKNHNQVKFKSMDPKFRQYLFGYLDMLNLKCAAAEPTTKRVQLQRVQLTKKISNQLELEWHPPLKIFIYKPMR